MIHELVVTRPFAGYARGAVITDADAMVTVLASENRSHVVRRAAKPPPEPEPVPAEPAAPTEEEAAAGVAAAEHVLHPAGGA